MKDNIQYMYEVYNECPLSLSVEIPEPVGTKAMKDNI